jgi:hypothetical protein
MEKERNMGLGFRVPWYSLFGKSVTWVSKNPIRESISHSLNSGEDSQILEKKRKEKKTLHRGAKKERRKDEKLTSSDTSTPPLMMSFPLRATTCTRNIFPRNPKPPKSLATRTNPTQKKKKPQFRRTRANTQPFRALGQEICRSFMTG